MAYRTWIHIKVIEQGSMTDKQTRKAFKQICEEVDLCYGEENPDDLEISGEDNNGCSFDSLVEISKKYPQLLFEGSIDGATEDSDDQRVFRVRNGQQEVIYMTKSFDPFETLLTTEEAKSTSSHALQQINKVELLGFVTKVAVKTVNGQRMAHLRLATNYGSMAADGKPVIETTFHDVIAYEGPHISFENLKDGATAHLTGRIRNTAYTRQDAVILATSLHCTQQQSVLEGL